MLLQLLELSIDTNTWLELRFQLGDHGVFFASHVFLELGVGHVVLVLGLEVRDHAAEILAYELAEELGAGVAVVNAPRGKDFVGQLGAGFEGEGFGEDERVVAVEEEGGDLRVLAGWD